MVDGQNYLVLVLIRGNKCSVNQLRCVTTPLYKKIKIKKRIFCGLSIVFLLQKEISCIELFFQARNCVHESLYTPVFGMESKYVVWHCTKRCSLHEVGENQCESRVRIYNRDKRHLVICLICLSLDGQNYLVLALGKIACTCWNNRGAQVGLDIAVIKKYIVVVFSFCEMI